MVRSLLLLLSCHAPLLVQSCTYNADCATDEMCMCQAGASRRSRALTVRAPNSRRSQQRRKVQQHATGASQLPDLGEESGRRLFGAARGGVATCTCVAAPPPPLPAVPPPASPPGPITVEWQSAIHGHCAPSPPPGTLQKTSGGGAWTCAAFTNAPPYQVASANDARHAMEFNCPCTSDYVNIGFMRANNPSFSTWGTNIQNTCTSNSACGYYNAGVEYGFSCRAGGNLYLHYNNQESHTHLGTYSPSSLLRIELGANTVTWYRDGSQIAQKSVTPTFPQNMFATLHNVNANCVPVTNLRLAV